jgi:hypothetical protein
MRRRRKRPAEALQLQLLVVPLWLQPGVNKGLVHSEFGSDRQGQEQGQLLRLWVQAYRLQQVVLKPWAL